jgi:hypothetical protein
MSDDTDFVALYDELGLDAECSMASFKHAYRRRIAKLHPDHPGSPSDISRIQRLNRLYAAALEFYRLHGRLPGAARPVGAIHTTPLRPSTGDVSNIHNERNEHAVETFASTWSASASSAASTATPMAGFPRRRRYLLMLALLALLLYWLGAQRTSVPTLDPEGPGDAVQPGLLAPASKQVAVGMEPDQVRRILGIPSTEHEQRWEYGPSWIEFRCGKVTGWYSSPLHPLQVEDDSAAAQAEAALKEPPRC